MEVAVAYRGSSGITGGPDAASLRFAANLMRDRVAFAGDLRHPLRFRELFSALHEIVVSDLRFQPKDHSAYQAWRKQQEQERQARQRAIFERLKQEAQSRAERPLPAGLEADFRRERKRYWEAREAWMRKIAQEDAALWERIRPRDPVVTVADDQVLFECFSTDESSYGALGVDRDAFGAGADAQYGTTNVDYSWALYDHLQGLRTYRPTRFAVAPEGIAVQIGEEPAYREQKIDLPPSWLRGFAQIGAAAVLPATTVPLPREALYAVLAVLRRRREKTGPRALRIELLSGRPPRLVLEPWETAVVAEGARWDGPDLPPLRLWGRRRLMAIARALPLVDRVELRALGNGLPWFVVLRCGEMRLTLGLSGWTVNDWTRSAALDLLAPPAVPEEADLRALGEALHASRSRTLDQLRGVVADPARLCASLVHLAGTGQVIHDLATGVYRWRQVVPRALGEAEKGPDHPELVAARALLRERRITVRESDQGKAGILLTGSVGGQDCEVLLDRDGRMRKAKCGCSHFHQGGLKKGPCRHLLSLRLAQQRQNEGGQGFMAWARWR